MTMRRVTVSVTTAADGTATAYSHRGVRGEIMQCEYVKHGSTPFDDGVDFTIEGEATGVDIWVQSNVNASAVVAPRQAQHSTAGVASLYAAGGTAVQVPVALANDRIKVGIAAGGNAKLGTFHFLVRD